METIVGSQVEKYLYNLLPQRDKVLRKMEEEAKILNIPIVGPLVGRFFYLLASIHQSRRIYEMGSAIGYSTIWWAIAAGRNGEIHYTDGSRKNADEAQSYFKEAGVAGSVKVHVGNALEIIDTIPGEFDLIFCDIDKGDYPAAFEKAVPRLRKGGLLVADNVLWGGTVATDAPSDLPGGDAWTDAVKQFNRLLYEAKDLHTAILPLRDGVSVSLKR